MSIDPRAHVVRSEIAVVLVELVPDQDRPLESRIQAAALLQRGHCRRIRGLLHAQDDIALVPHEVHIQVLDLLGQVLLRGIHGEVPETRQVHDLHVHAARGLDADVDGLGADVLAQLLVHLTDQRHHLVQVVLLPHLCLHVPHKPARASGGGDVAELEDRWPPAAQRPGDEVECLSGQRLDEAALADRLLAKEDELGHGEVYDAQLVLHASLDIAKQV
mmetsp:Transcript_17942/g.47294  ORF Transcript_17942/g.47294 Transcript_17942/m.47294 type:complete len:218 (-) Transcript_17942:108-761(-)